MVVLDLLKAVEEGRTHGRVKLGEEFIDLRLRDAAGRYFNDRHLQWSKRTAGHLLRQARAVVRIPDDLDAVISKAVEDRNYLCHRFFSERAYDFVSDAGRAKMIAELQGMIGSLSAAEKALVELVLPPFEAALGVTRERIDREFERILAHAEQA